MMNKRLIFVSAILFCGYAANGWAGVRVPDMATPRVLTAEVSDVQEDTIYVPIIDYYIGGASFPNPFRKDWSTDTTITQREVLIINQIEMTYAPDTYQLMPRYVDGNFYTSYKGLDQYVEKAKTRECEDIEKTGVHGRVIVSFVVEKDGQITHPTVLQRVHPVLDAQAVKIVEGMHRWQPGTKDGQPVRSQFILAVNYLDFSKREEMEDYVRMHPWERVEIDKKFIKGEAADAIKKQRGIIPLLYIENVVTSYPSFSYESQTVEQFVSNVMIYPKAAGTEKGVVNINMVVNEDGSLSDVQVGSTSNPVFNDEAVRIVKSMPAWTPAKFKGKPVRLKVSLPIKFQPQETSSSMMIGSFDVKGNDEIGGEMLRAKEIIAQPESPTTKDQKVFDVVEQMPSYPGGPNALFAYLSTIIHYPEDAEENGAQGRVIVTFVVENDGSISEVKVAKSVFPSLDKEAVRVVSSMPRWNPGKQNGKAVRVKYTVPVTFRLELPQKAVSPTQTGTQTPVK